MIRFYFFIIILIIIFYCCSQSDTDTNVVQKAVSPSAVFNLSPDELLSLQEKAKNGDALAADKVSDYYAFIKLDLKESIKWLEIAAKNGLPMAQYNLGITLSTLPDKQSHKDSFYWFQRAAESGVRNAFVHIAEEYEKGEVIEKDFNKAKTYYEKAALSGDANAMITLSDYYIDGKGGPKDIVQAYAWIKLAESKIDARSITGQEIASKKNDILAQLSPADLQSAEKQYEQLLIKIIDDEKVGGVTKVQ